MLLKNKKQTQNKVPAAATAPTAAALYEDADMSPLWFLQGADNNDF